VRAGDLRERVTILRQEDGLSTTGSGMMLETWVLVATVRARVTPISQREAFTGDHRFASATTSFRMRYRRIEASWRLEWRGEQYNIEGAVPGGQGLREYVDVLASASPAENPTD